MEQVIDHVEAMKNDAKVLPDGIYVTLPEDVYHADPALGSTSLKKLVDNAPDFWWDSWMNPAREPEVDTPAKIFGRAVHIRSHRQHFGGKPDQDISLWIGRGRSIGGGDIIRSGLIYWPIASVIRRRGGG